MLRRLGSQNRVKRPLASAETQALERDPQIWPKKRPFWGCAWKPAFRGDWMVEVLCDGPPPPADAPGVLRAALGVALGG